MSSELPDRIRSAAATPSRNFDVDRARRRIRRHRLIAGTSGGALALVAVLVAGFAFGDSPASQPLIEDRVAPSGEVPSDEPTGDCAAARQAMEVADREDSLRDGEIRRLRDDATLACDPPPEHAPPPPVTRCSDASPLSGLEAADEIADEVVLFAACPTAERQAGTLTGPYFALGRGISRAEATAADLVALYAEGLTRAEAADGYILTRPDVAADDITATPSDGTVTVSFTSEALGDDVSASYASTALLEEFGALFLQLPHVDTVRFAVEGSCEDFATAVERSGACVEVNRDQIGVP